MSPPLELVILTDAYPFHAAYEQTFLDPEVRVLAQHFERIHLVPQRLGGDCSPLPARVTVDTRYAIRHSPSLLRALGRACWSRLFYADIRARWPLTLNLKAIKRLSVFCAQAEFVAAWFQHLFQTNALTATHTIFYSFWLDAACGGIALLKERYPDICLVARAHSADLYEDRYTPPYLPGRWALARGLDRLLPDSQLGADYIQNCQPMFASICTPSRQGVDDPGFQTAPSADGVLRVVSCSFVIPRKRVHLLLEGLILAAQADPNQRWHWTHIGDGPGLAALVARQQTGVPPNLQMEFPGYWPAPQMLAYYRDQPIDIFANVSDNEGTPVSLMEAASCGIPILATAVGGNLEVVSEDNGALLEAHLTAEAIAQKLIEIAQQPSHWQARRAVSRAVWQDKYNASTNYREFSQQLLNLRLGTPAVK